MTDYQLSLSHAEYTQFLLQKDEGGFRSPTSIFYPQNGGGPVGMKITDQNASFYVQVISTDKKDKLSFTLENEGQVMTKSVVIGRRREITKVLCYEVDINCDGADDIVATAVDDQNRFYTGVIVFSGQDSLPIYTPFYPFSPECEEPQ